MPSSVSLLVNPASGSGRAAVAAGRVLTGLRALGAEPTVLIGRSAADSARLAREAVRKRPDALVAVGGDGMVHTALQAVAGTDVPLGVVPAGTGNDIARELGIGRSATEAAERIARGYTVPADTVHCTGRGVDLHYLSVLACGFDSRVNERVNGFSVPMGRAGYLVGLAAELRSFRPIPYRIEVDGEVLEAEGMLAAVGNTRCYGGGMKVCPGARYDDGLLEVVFVHAVAVSDFVRFFPRVFGGTHTELDEVTVLRGRRVTITTGGGTPVAGYADGERVGDTPLTCEIAPKSVRVLM
ncbi:diacylglycerol/lipid kinase family protein [Nocardiopsis potens]|uniref:diacylglycerol/lipid kinase family protein n=1 Tax=Nocardiopsis potens TaxID=1246458 RepID=UPI0003488BC4|nr:YegS/Rv2252/BmrU family lipid kinase [Nocardiopsis potens]